MDPRLSVLTPLSSSGISQARLLIWAVTRDLSGAEPYLDISHDVKLTRHRREHGNRYSAQMMGRGFIATNPKSCV